MTPEEKWSKVIERCKKARHENNYIYVPAWLLLEKDREIFGMRAELADYAKTVSRLRLASRAPKC